MIKNIKRLLISLIFCLLILSGCHPKEGSRCDPRHEGQCKGKNAIMVCEGGVWKEYPCNGEEGCWYDNKDTSLCDQGFSYEGDRCFRELEGFFACSLDDEQDVLICISGHFEVNNRCPGDKVCTAVNNEYLDCL